MNCDRVICLGNGGLGSGETGCLKAQDIDKFILPAAFLKPFVLNPGYSQVTPIPHPASR